MEGGTWQSEVKHIMNRYGPAIPAALKAWGHMFWDRRRLIKSKGLNAVLRARHGSYWGSVRGHRMCDVFVVVMCGVVEEGKPCERFSSVWQACGRSGMWAHVGRAQWDR